MQTANIHSTDNVYEVNPLSLALVGQNPSSSDAYQLMATYAVSHYAISRTLPKKWRRYWHAGMIGAKAGTVIRNHEIGL
jgi:hypothetical protein